MQGGQEAEPYSRPGTSWSVRQRLGELDTLQEVRSDETQLHGQEQYKEPNQRGWQSHGADSGRYQGVSGGCPLAAAILGTRRAIVGRTRSRIIPTTKG